ncbi:hypothetical protein BDR07DRAFT_1419422 [Suillus spraguei]|nr:hypothetical protein BDR07DRAFT_1419422 [Suillus spraguei]
MASRLAFPAHSAVELGCLSHLACCCDVKHFVNTQPCLPTSKDRLTITGTLVSYTSESCRLIRQYPISIISFKWYVIARPPSVLITASFNFRSAEGDDALCLS